MALDAFLGLWLELLPITAGVYWPTPSPPSDPHRRSAALAGPLRGVGLGRARSRRARALGATVQLAGAPRADQGLSNEE